jgi:small subunit ribosomal protein S2
MEIPSLKELMEAGVHFGHKKARTYPKSKQYTFGIRQGIYIIDLEKTQTKLNIAAEFLKKQASEGKTILFVGTKFQAKELVVEAATSVKMPFISQRWYGGLLTNFDTIFSSIKKLQKMESSRDSEAYLKLTKKERLKTEEKITKLHKDLDGIINLTRVPDSMLIVDISSEKNAVAEAKKIGIPIVGICDTNANPELVDMPVPSNDDAKKSLELIIGVLTDAIKEGLKNKVVNIGEEKKDGNK